MVGCNYPGLSGDPTPTVTVRLPPPFITSGSSDSATPSGGTGPTALPSPTPFLTPTPRSESPEEEAPGFQSPGLFIEPDMGELGESIVVTGGGFEPGEEVSLYWTVPDEQPGQAFQTIEADEEGGFRLTTTVPTTWPGRAPQSGDFLQLQAVAGFYACWANFRYVTRFGSQPTLTQTYTNTTYGYAIDLPGGWSWDDSDTANVTFNLPSGPAEGFIRVEPGSDTNAIVGQVMQEIAPAASPAPVQAMLGATMGTQAATGDGRVVWFIPDGDRVVVLSFWDDTFHDYAQITTTFRFMGN
jgi:hypothetical protein